MPGGIGIPRRLAALAAPLVAAAVLAAWVPAPVAAGARRAGPDGFAYGYRAALAELPVLYAGTDAAVDPTPRPAARGAAVALVSAGQASLSYSTVVDAAAVAAQALGWRTEILDGRLEPPTYPGLVERALRSGVSGIVLDGVNCDQVRGALEEARARHVAVVPVDSAPCTGPGARLFSAEIDDGGRPGSGPGDFAESTGRAEADYVIARSRDRARVLVLDDPADATVAGATVGFDDQIAHSGGSRVVATVDFATSDLGTPLQHRVATALAQHPGVTWIESPTSYATTLGVVPVIGPSATRRVQVIGGEGLQPEVADVAVGSVTAVVAVSLGWTGWAAVDTLNSVLTHRQVYDSGIGWQLVDATHNLAPGGDLVPPVDYQDAYERAWGVQS